MKKLTTLIASTLLLATISMTLGAMPPKQIKQVLDLTRNNWVAFRDFNGRQLISFTHLESYTCGINQVRYSLNSDALDKTWELQPCKQKSPSPIKKDIIYLTLPLGTAKSIAVQVTFTDGTKSEIIHKTP